MRPQITSNVRVPDATESTESTQACITTLSYLIFVFRARALISHPRPVAKITKNFIVLIRVHYEVVIFASQQSAR